MANFKTGDLVRLENYEPYNDYRAHKGEVARIEDISIDGVGLRYTIVWPDGSRSFAGDDEDRMIAVNEVKEDKMSIVDKVRDIAMSKEDRLIRKHEVRDECGSLTRAGKDLLLEVLFEENKALVVAKLQDVEAAEKEEKKGKK